MNLLRRLIRLVPPSVKAELKQRVKGAASPTGSEILSRLYLPDISQTVGGTEITWKITDAGRKIAWNRPAATQPSPEIGFAIPPHDLRMGYARDDREFLQSGRRTSELIRRIADQHAVSLRSGPVLEWGCASGRVIRHFADEARDTPFWGIDVDGSHLNWAKANLSPPFKFLTCTAYPHLPFEDNSVDVVYGISVFTHMVHLIDAWLMEFRRILVPGGHAVFTIHDEHTWNYLGQSPDHRPPWVGNEDLTRGLTADMVVFCDGTTPSWGSTFSFFRTDWIAREWGQYFDVVSFEPFAADYQTAVVLKKPERYQSGAALAPYKVSSK